MMVKEETCVRVLEEIRSVMSSVIREEADRAADLV